MSAHAGKGRHHGALLAGHPQTPTAGGKAPSALPHMKQQLAPTQKVCGISSLRPPAGSAKAHSYKLTSATNTKGQSHAYTTCASKSPLIPLLLAFYLLHVQHLSPLQISYHYIITIMVLLHLQMQLLRSAALHLKGNSMLHMMVNVVPDC